MKNPDTEMNDELRPEYDLHSLQVRKIGSGRKGLINRSKLANQFDNYENLPEREIELKLQALKRIYQVFQGNFQELNQWLKHLECPNLSQKEYPSEKTESFQFLEIETSRLLHNFLASAKSLVDHTRVIIDALYPTPFKFKQEYHNKLEEMVIQAPVQKFIQDLRNYTLYYALPLQKIQGNLQFINKQNSQYGYCMQIKLDDKFRKWDGWNGKAKDYLTQFLDSIDIKSLVSEYHILIEDFYKWLEQRQQELHKEDFAK